MSRRQRTNKGIAIVLSLILLSFTVMFASILAYSSLSSATSYAESVVMSDQLKDIDSAVATDVMSIILLIPHGGRINYTMSYLPPSIAGGKYYVVQLNISRGNEGFVNASCEDHTVSLCIGGFGWELNGSINSTKISISRG